MFVIDWKLSLICLAPFPLLIIATYFFKESVNKSFIRGAMPWPSSMPLCRSIYRHARAAGICFRRTGVCQIQNINKTTGTPISMPSSAYSVLFFRFVEIVLAVSTAWLIWLAASEAHLFKRYRPATGRRFERGDDLVLFIPQPAVPPSSADSR